MSAYIHFNGSWGQLHSGAAKAGVNAITKVLATEWGPHGIRVCGIMPGGIEDTEGFARLVDVNNINNKNRSKDSFSRNKGSASGAGDMTALIPQGRFGKCIEIANTALFLGSDAASYITGTDVIVDGGQILTAPNFMFAFPEFVNKWK